MRKLLAILSTISIIPSTLPIMAISPKMNSIKTYQAYSLDSFKNIIRIINDKFQNNSENMDSDYMDEVLDSLSPSYYVSSIKEREGEVFVWNSRPRNDTIILKTYQNTYINPDSQPQKRLTQSRTETISETHSFSINVSEKITSSVENKIEGKIKVPVAEIKEALTFKFGIENGTDKNWTESKTTTIQETVPSQEILQNPKTILYVTYKVTQGTINYDGIARFRVDDAKDKIFRIPLFTFNKIGLIESIWWHNYSIEEFLQILKDTGQINQLDVNQKSKYSIISVDNIDNPFVIFVNLPITWTSPSSGLILEHHEEPYENSII